jgi:archaellum component FlaC
VDHNQYIVLALANVPTTVAVLIGFLINNGRLGDMNARLSDMSARIGSVENRVGNLENKFDTRLDNLETKFDTRFDMLLSKVVEIDNRLIRLEAQRH